MRTETNGSPERSRFDLAQGSLSGGTRNFNWLPTLDTFRTFVGLFAA
jgi:hypothetical protein